MSMRCFDLIYNLRHSILRPSNINQKTIPFHNTYLTMTERNPYDMQSASSFAINVTVQDKRINQLITELNKQLLLLREQIFNEDGNVYNQQYYEENNRQAAQLKSMFEVYSIADFFQKQQQLNNSQSRKQMKVKPLCECCYAWVQRCKCRQDKAQYLLLILFCFTFPVLICMCCTGLRGQYTNVLLLRGKLLNIYNKYKRKATMLNK